MLTSKFQSLVREKTSVPTLRYMHNHTFPNIKNGITRKQKKKDAEGRGILTEE